VAEVMQKCNYRYKEQKINVMKTQKEEERSKQCPFKPNVAGYANLDQSNV
jgi:hypothetical protein